MANLTLPQKRADQKANRLFKKSVGKAEAKVGKLFSNETIDSPLIVLPDNIWTESSQIPNNADPLLGNNGDVEGVVQLVDVTLEAIQGTEGQAYTHPDLNNIIPFNFGDQSSRGQGDKNYNYLLRDNDGGVIPPGTNGWLFDNSAGVLTFYEGLPNKVGVGQPPSMRVYKYVGKTGFPDGTGGGAPTTQLHYQSQTVDNTDIVTDVDASIDKNNQIVKNVSLAAEPTDYPKIQVYVNGQRLNVGSGSTAVDSDCWFISYTNANSGNSTTNIREFTALIGGTQNGEDDVLVFNVEKTGYALDGNDRIDITFEKSI